MEEINEELRLEEFINAVKVLHKRLTAFEKDKLYNVKKQVKMKQIVDWKPILLDKLIRINRSYYFRLNFIRHAL